MVEYSDDELLEEITHLADEYGRPPTLQEIDEETDYWRKVYFNHFGSWQAALKEAGFEPRSPQEEIPDSDLIAELERLEKELGHAPSAQEMNEHGEYWASTYKNHFGSWTAAIEEAGLEPDKAGTKISRRQLVAELNRLGETLDKRPTLQEMEDNGEYDPSTYIHEFGSWTDAVNEAGFEEPIGLTEECLVEDLQELAETLDKQPSQRDMNQYGEHSHTTYVRYFGSWSDAIEAAFETE